MNMLKKAATALLFGCMLLSQAVIAHAPKKGHSSVTQVSAENRAVTFINNFAIVATLIDGNDAHVAEVQKVVDNASVYVNDHLIGHGESLYLPIVNDSYVIEIVTSAATFEPFLNDPHVMEVVRSVAKLKPFFNTLDFFRLNPLVFFRVAASLVEVKVKFSVSIAPGEDEVEILYPIIAKAEEWQESNSSTKGEDSAKGNFPPYTIRYRNFPKIQLSFEDVKEQ